MPFDSTCVIDRRTAGAVSMRDRGCRGFWTTGCWLLWFFWAAAARADAPALVEGHRSRSEAETMARQYVERVTRQFQLAAENEFRRKEADRLDLAAASPSENLLLTLGTLDAEARASLTSILQQNHMPLAEDLGQAADNAQQRWHALGDRWQGTRSTLYEEQLELYEIEANRQVAGQLASLLSVDNRWFWLCGLIAVASLVAVAAHDRRHEVRRRLNGGRARSMGLSKALAALMACLTLITLATFIFGDRIYHSLLRVGLGGEASPRDRMVADGRAAATKQQELERERQQIDEQYDVASERLAKQTLAGSPEAKRLFDSWRASRQSLEKLSAGLAVEAGIAQAMLADLKALEKYQADIQINAEERNAYARKRRWIRGGLGTVLAGLAAGGGLLFQRGVGRRRRKTRDTCPLCLAEGTFAAVDSSEGHIDLGLVQCKNVISQHPYEECEFTFLSMYREIVKLCFPTLGIPQAGKTHWLAMVYRELNRGNYPEVVQFERIKSTSSDEFDLVVEEILHRKLGPMATQVGRIPHPLVFNFLDRDHFGSSNVLVNIFDYSGEVTRSQTIESRQRQRALDGDGFFFFLDPTEPSETQSQALASFREDLRRIKGVRTGRQVHIPVALCVSKIDLMVDQPYADPEGGGVIGNFYQDLGEIGWDFNLPSIEARSRVMARLRDTIWPGWQIERQIDDLFGGRYMFFPLTPVGLDGLGERDLSRRTIAPVGLIEPLVWLLHMNGYPVLK